MAQRLLESISMRPALKLLAISLFALVMARSRAEASLIFLYDFPGGSGLASNQTNGQPSKSR
jgi:hypothetical protein